MQFAGSWKIAKGLFTSFLYLIIWREKSHQKYLSQSHIHRPKNMDFSGSRKNRRSRTNPLDSSQNAGKHTHGLQIYKVPPTDNITLEEFEEFAIDRLKGTIERLQTSILLKEQEFWLFFAWFSSRDIEGVSISWCYLGERKDSDFRKVSISTACMNLNGMVKIIWYLSFRAVSSHTDKC